MTGSDLATREEQTLELIDSGAFADRVEPLLPDTLPLRRFLQVAKTAIRTNPDIVEADQRTLMGALIRCAQDGLVPDGREAALNIYNTKRGDDWVKAVQYLPMIGGLRKNLAEYGWTLKTRVVFANDEFSYSEEPQQIRHLPVRPGAERGDRVAVYAIATHKDGRRLQIALNADDVDKRKAKAKTDKVWKEWPDAMWEKSAGHAIFDEIPRAERDRMLVPTDNGVDDAVELLYGPDGQQFHALEASAGHPPDGDGPKAVGNAAEVSHSDGGEPQQAEDTTRPTPMVSSAPGADDPEPEAPWVAAGKTVVDGGQWAGKTLAEIAETEPGREWLAWALRNQGRFEAAVYAAIETYVGGALPDLWAAHDEKSAA